VRARWWVVIGCGLAVILAGTLGLLTRGGSPGVRPAPAQAATLPGPTMPAPTAPIVAAQQPAPPRQVALPQSLTIPQIAVSTRLVSLGLTSQGAVQVPATTTVAGWYTHSPRPGAVGPAVILGHIDSDRGPGVFFRLATLRPGDLIYVRLSDGSTVSFRVTRVQTYQKDEFPTESVYGPTPDQELRLITCGGAFDSASGHYLSNIVVYATARNFGVSPPPRSPDSTP
jgi:sortase (surface protein transpeptidase)